MKYFICVAAILGSIYYSAMANAEEITPEKNSNEKLYVVSNPLYTKGYRELMNVYDNPGGSGCLAYSRHLQGIRPSGYAALSKYKQIAKYDETACKKFQKVLPYTLAEVVDPKAILIYKDKRSRETCKGWEKVVKGKTTNRLKSCLKYYN